MCHTVYPSVHTSSFAHVNCNESLVWFEVSSFCDTINIASSLRSLQEHVVTLCHEDPAVLDPQDRPFNVPQQFTEDVDLGVGRLKDQDLSLRDS